MGTINGGYYFNVLYLTFDYETKKIVEREIEGPIPVCEKIFKNQKNCNYTSGDDLQAAGELVSW